MALVVRKPKAQTHHELPEFETKIDIRKIDFPYDEEEIEKFLEENGISWEEYDIEMDRREAEARRDAAEALNELAAEFEEEAEASDFENKRSFLRKDNETHKNHSCVSKCIEMTPSQKAEAGQKARAIEDKKFFEDYEREKAKAMAAEESETDEKKSIPKKSGKPGITQKEPEAQDFTKDPVRKNGSFKLNNKQVFLTYRTHIDKEDYRKWAQDELDPFDEFYIAWENADLTDPYEHTHVYFKFCKSYVASDCRCFDFPISDVDDLHPNIRVLGAAKVDEIKIKYYISKEDQDPDLVALRASCNEWNKANGDKARFKKSQWDEKNDPLNNIADKVWACQTIQEAIRTCAKEYGDVCGVRAIWQEKMRKELEPVKWEDIAEFTWQKEFRDMFLAKDWNHRRLKWIWDPKGGAGKSTFADYMVKAHGALYLSNCCNSRDIATLVQEHINLGGCAKYIILDLPRASKMHKMWDTVEMLLNGKMTVGKWHGQPLYFDKPRMIVCANYPPPLDEDNTLSKDRWDIYKMREVSAEESPDGEHDRVLDRLPNPDYNADYKKPTRFQAKNLD